MAAPTKEEREKREKIKKLGLFVRDNDIYTIFEENMKDVNNFFIPYHFCELCSNKSFIQSTEGNKLFKALEDTNNHNNRFPQMNNELKKLFDLDIGVFSYYYMTTSDLFCNKDKDTNLKPYNVYNEIYFSDVKEALGEEFAKEHVSEGYTYFEFLDKLEMTDEQSTKLKNYYRHNSIIGKTYKTLIEKSHLQHTIEDILETNKVKSTYVELDFTKPIDELIEFITMIKNDFDEDPTTIQNIHDLTGYENEIYKNGFKDIYKTNHIKPIGGRLADVLFIYDCKKVNEIMGGNILTNDYILDEINKYWTETRNLFKDKMQLSTLREYHNIAMDYIDNEKYKCYLTGYNLSN